jgi:hypothetical protein
MRQMQARYNGTCAACGGSIRRGTQILWNRQTRQAYHATGSCPETAYEAADAARGMGDDDYSAVERRHMDREYSRGVALGEHIRQTRDMFGEEAALAEEIAWERKDPDPAY